MQSPHCVKNPSTSEKYKANLEKSEDIQAKDFQNYKVIKLIYPQKHKVKVTQRKQQMMQGKSNTCTYMN